MINKEPIVKTFTRGTTLGDVTVHGGRKKVTGGEIDFSGLAAEFLTDPTPLLKERKTEAIFR